MRLAYIDRGLRSRPEPDSIGGLLIGEMAKRCGLTPRALRLYEEKGLLWPARIDGGVRIYRAADVEVALFIKVARQNGLAVHQIGELIQLQETAGVRAMRARLLNLCEERLSLLQKQRLYLEDLIADLRGSSRAHIRSAG